MSGVFQWGPGDFWKKDCSRSGFPAVYTNIYNLRTWVDDVIQNVPPPERVENYRIYLLNSQTYKMAFTKTTRHSNQY